MQNKKLILRIICMLLMAALAFAAVVGIGLITKTEATRTSSWVLDLGTITDESGLLAHMIIDRMYDDFDGGACSVAVKTLENGDTIVGRNMDMKLSNSPVYVGRTDIGGFYSTIFLSYVQDFGPSYDECLSDGVPGYISKIMPFTALDSLNNEGLYIQTNMREDQLDSSGNKVFACEYTNKDADYRISAVELPTYVTLRCKNVDEAIELISNLDIYTLGGDIGWPFAYIMADAEGNYGLLELGADQIKWIPYQNVQTNYYVSPLYSILQSYKQGLGRYDYLKENLDSVTSETDMRALLSDIKYSNLYSDADLGYEIRSEFAGDQEYMTNAYLNDDTNWETVRAAFSAEAEVFRTLGTGEKHDADRFWSTVYTAVVNCSQKTISLNFFENYGTSYSMGFESIDTGILNDKSYVFAMILAELLCIIVAMLLIYGSIFEARKSTDKLSKRQCVYSVALSINLAGLIFDVLSWVFDGNILHPWVARLTTGLSMIITYILISAFCMFLLALLEERGEVNKLPFRLFNWACVVAVIITAIMYQKDLMYIVQDGSYYEAPLYAFYSSVNGVFVVVMLAMVFSHRQLLGFHDILAIIIYTIMPVISAVISAFWPQISLGYPSCTIAFLVIYIMLQSENAGRLVSERDISSYIANHDQMTNLLSRRAYIETLENLEKTGADNPCEVGVLFADINGLKYTNDQFGHSKGDELLISFADIARKAFTENCIYRISGDEFVVLMPDVTEKEWSDRIDKFNQAVQKTKPPIACYGILFGSSSMIDDLIHLAESEMYIQKEKFYVRYPEMKR